MASALQISCWEDVPASGKFKVVVQFGGDRWNTEITASGISLESLRVCAEDDIARGCSSTGRAMDDAKEYGKKMLAEVLKNAPFIRWATLRKIIVDGPEQLLAEQWEMMTDPHNNMQRVGNRYEIVRVVNAYRAMQPIPLQLNTPVVRVLVVAPRPGKEKVDMTKEAVRNTLSKMSRLPELHMDVDVLTPPTWQRLLEHLDEKGVGHYHAMIFDGPSGSYGSAEIDCMAALKDGEGRVVPGTIATPLGARIVDASRDGAESRVCVLFEWPDSPTRTDAVDATDFACAMRNAQIPVVMMFGGRPAFVDKYARTTVEKRSNSAADTYGSSVLHRLAMHGVNAAVGCMFTMPDFSNGIFASTLLECVFRKHSTMSDAVYAARFALANNSEKSPNGVKLETWMMPRLVQRTWGDVKLLPREMTVREGQEWRAALAVRFASTDTAPAARPTVEEMVKKKVKFIPVDELADILGDIRGNFLGAFGQALPTHDGFTRPMHKIRKNMEATDVIDLWTHDCGSNATIAVLLNVLEKRFYSSYEKLLNWVQKNSQLDN